jgi:hypothetical protein
MCGAGGAFLLWTSATALQKASRAILKLAGCIPRGLKPTQILQLLAARLKSCPDTNRRISAPVKPVPFNADDWLKIALVARGKGQQGDVPGLLDGASEAALVGGANAGEPPGHDLAALGHKALQQADIAVGYRVDLLGAELADLLAAEELAAAAGSTGGAAAGSAAGPSA